MNGWDIVILVLVAGAAALGLWQARKRRKAGKGCCGCPGCAGSCGSCTGGCERRETK